jgi:hypothetical protein
MKLVAGQRITTLIYDKTVPMQAPRLTWRARDRTVLA